MCPHTRAISVCAHTESPWSSTAAAALPLWPHHPQPLLLVPLLRLARRPSARALEDSEVDSWGWVAAGCVAAVGEGRRSITTMREHTLIARGPLRSRARRSRCAAAAPYAVCSSSTVCRMQQQHRMPYATRPQATHAIQLLDTRRR
jgi:hypothetical protein